MDMSIVKKRFYETRISAETISIFIFVEKKKLKKLVFLTKSWVNPFTKIPKMATFEISISKEEILFMKIEHHRKRFQGLFCRKMKKEKISYF